MKTIGSMVTCLIFANAAAADSWRFESARDEIRPESKIVWELDGKPKQLIVQADNRPGLSGCWTKDFAIEPDQHYRFSVQRKTEGMPLPRRSAIVRILWQDSEGNPVTRRDPAVTSYRENARPRAEPEFPAPAKDPNNDGWTRLQAVYQAPPNATRAKVELHFRWGPPHSSVRWSTPSLQKCDPRQPRMVRLAAVHYQPREGSTPKEKREQFAPLIAKAAEQQVDLAVLPESLTFYGTGKSYAECAEPIPGPSTEYFGKLAKQHDLYIVAGILERDEHLVYNTSVLIGPEGELVGSYRKVTLPRSEIEGGLMPGDEYPVFETRFGKVGMMICYDGFFPEVARELSLRGAEVIAWPVWGCNPLLAQARACENHVYVVSSTYTAYDNNWMQSAIYGHDGRTLAHAEEFGTLAIAEVNLNQPTYWHSLGDFRAQIEPHRPVTDPTP